MAHCVSDTLLVSEFMNKTGKIPWILVYFMEFRVQTQTTIYNIYKINNVHGMVRYCKTNEKNTASKGKRA